MDYKTILERLAIILFIVSYADSVYSQVTIGSYIRPIQGSLLDLKQDNNQGVNSQKGLALSRITLQTQTDLHPIISNASTEDKDAHIGLVAHNVTDNIYHCSGVQVWDSKKWVNLSSEGALSALSAPDSYILDLVSRSIFLFLKHMQYGISIYNNARVKNYKELFLPRFIGKMKTDLLRTPLALSLLCQYCRFSIKILSCGVLASWILNR